MPKDRQIGVNKGRKPTRARRIPPLRSPILPLALAIFSSSAAAAGAAEKFACEREMARAARQQGIPLNVLFAVGLTETGSRGALSPYDINVDRRSIHLDSLEEALDRVAYEQARGAKFIDIGCMQINHRWHGKNFGSLSEMFDPGRNVAYAARFLKELREREGSWTLAVARYNAGPDNNPAQKIYVCAVLRNMVASGFGRWTANARQFCGLPLESAENEP